MLQFLAVFFVLAVFGAIILCIVAAVHPFSIGKFTLLASRKNALIGIPSVLAVAFASLCLIGLADISEHPENYPTEPTPAAAAEKAVEKAKGQVAAEPRISTVAREDDIEISIVKTSALSEIGSTKPAEGGVLVAIEYKLRNVGTKPIKPSNLPEIRLMDDLGTVYTREETKRSAYRWSAEIDRKEYSNLNPDIAVRDADVFEVSATKFNPATWYAVTEDGTRIALQ